MKRNLTLVCVLNGICVAVFAAVCAVGFIYGVLTAGIIGAFLTLVALWTLAGNIYREWLFDVVEHRFAARDFAGARACLDRAERNQLLYPIVRVTAFQLSLKVALALDDIPTAARCVNRLRHNGGDGWRYRTAYAIILLNLDWDDVDAARAEYEAFRNACAHSAIYRTRLEALSAVFSHLNGEETALPDEIKNSPYPIVHRVVRKYC